MPQDKIKQELMMTNDVDEKIKTDEYLGEILINKVRLALGLIFLVCILAISILRYFDNLGFFPLRAYSFTSLFFLYGVALIFYLKKNKNLHPYFKFITTILDMVLISAAIWIGCTYLEQAPPLPFLSIQALFYVILILAGSFRFSVPCAYFSGIFASICYIIVVIANKNVLDLPYYFIYEGRTIPISFPIYIEAFRTLGMLVAGILTAMACKRQLKLLANTIKTESDAAQNAADTVKNIFMMSKTINKSTNEIFNSSKEIFSTANNQAASIQEIESTIRENALIATEISEKTANVADITSKMEDDVLNGFKLLQLNVNKLEDIKNENSAVISGIVELENKLEKIQDFILSIEEITDQTKVIAFNASLEAASAGERGNRFSVVANEVNRLADDIAALTKQIRKQANEIKASSSSLITSGEKSSNKISEGNNLIKELENIFYDIRNGAETTTMQSQTITVSTQKQQKSIEQINTAIKDISSGLANFLNSTKIATSSAEGLTDLIKKLDNILTGNITLEGNNEN